jgi:opacity protein-like surface antigen
MKSYLGMAIVAICLFNSAEAQQISKKKFINIGIKGGLNLFNIINDNNVSYDSKAGVHAGLIGHIHLTRQIALQPELVYSVQGAQFDVAGVNNKINLGYINVPLMVQYMFDNGFRLQAGPQIGFLANAKSKTNNASFDVKNNFKKVDIGLGAGIGYVEPSSGLGIDARYNFGLSDINENTAVKSTNRGFQIGLFYLFQHK